MKALRYGLAATGTKNFLNDSIHPIFNWSQRTSLFPLHFGLACCAMEMMAAGAPRFDSERLGILFRSSPRQCDLLIVAGTITKKMRPRLKTLYEQMPEPKWVIAMGNCAISGGPFFDSYTIVNGADEIIPVDIYLPGCPPRPEALLYAITKLQEKIGKEKRNYLQFG
ncbi:MAG: NADH-quinone oxidoreductase subunit B family protein [Candidatus Thermoplasmatota archaeon]